MVTVLSDLSPPQEGQPTTVFTSATYLIHQTNMVMITVKDKCE